MLTGVSTFDWHNISHLFLIYACILRGRKKCMWCDLCNPREHWERIIIFLNWLQLKYYNCFWSVMNSVCYYSCNIVDQVKIEDVNWIFKIEWLWFRQKRLTLKKWIPHDWNSQNASAQSIVRYWSEANVQEKMNKVISMKTWKNDKSKNGLLLLLHTHIQSPSCRTLSSSSNKISLETSRMREPFHFSKFSTTNKL